MSVSLVEVMVAASRRLAPLSGECAGHAVLAAADQLLSNPRLIGAAEVLIEESGAVRLAGGLASDERGCDRGLRGLLDGLLAVAHSGGAGLFRVGQRTPTGDLGQLVKELEVALIPANRAAARRSLARLHRETERARHAGRLESASDALQIPRAAHAPIHDSSAELSPSELELLAVTEVRFATGPRAAALGSEPTARHVETDLAIDVDPDASARAPEVVVQTQPLPKVVPRREVHETAPLPPVSTEARVRPEHETPLEPVLGRRFGGVPTPRHESADIHKTPYLGTLIATAPHYDPRPHERWLRETPSLAEAASAMPDTSTYAGAEDDDATTDPAPVVAWAGADEVIEAVSDNATELLDAQTVSHEVMELAEADVMELAEADVMELGDDMTQLVEDDVTELAEDDVTELAEDDVTELAEDDVTELVEAAPFAPCAALSIQPRVIEPLELKPPRVPRTSDVEALLERFRVAEPEPDPLLVRGLKQLAGITVTPPPVLARTDATQTGPELTSTPATELSRGEAGDPIRPVPTVRIVAS